MATKKKAKKNKSAYSKKMTADVEAKVEVKKLLKDERSHKIVGTILILISILLFLSFTSYLFTWQEDQSKVFKGAKILLPSHAERMANLLGTAGAYFSDLFFRSGFGIASYLFCTFFFIVGVNLFAPKKIFSVGRNVRYVIVGLLVISVSASFLMKGHPFPWGGAVGDMENQWLQQIIGKVGTAALLFVAFLSYVIWRFNPSLDILGKNLVALKGKVVNNEISPQTDSIKDFSIKASDDDIAPLTNIPASDDNGLNHDLQIIEKNVQPPVVKEVGKEFSIPDIKEEKNKVPILNSSPETGLKLEVKSFPAEMGNETELISKAKPQQQPYDPILDLRNYKFPTIDLLETHGSERIIQDATELETNKNQIINTLEKL